MMVTRVPSASSSKWHMRLQLSSGFRASNLKSTSRGMDTCTCPRALGTVTVTVLVLAWAAASVPREQCPLCRCNNVTVRHSRTPTRFQITYITVTVTPDARMSDARMEQDGLLLAETLARAQFDSSLTRRACHWQPISERPSTPYLLPWGLPS